MDSNTYLNVVFLHISLKQFGVVEREAVVETLYNRVRNIK